MARGKIVSLVIPKVAVYLLFQHVRAMSAYCAALRIIWAVIVLRRSSRLSYLVLLLDESVICQLLVWISAHPY
jgi:hypothetical protein